MNQQRLIADRFNIAGSLSGQLSGEILQNWYKKA